MEERKQKTYWGDRVYSPHQEFDKEFVVQFVKVLRQHRSLSPKTVLFGLQGKILLDFAHALGIAEEVLDRNYAFLNSEETNNKMLKDLVDSIIEKIGK